MTSEPQNIYLVGPMGSGKSTIGNRLAQKMGLTFYDSDHEIEARTGASVSLIFEIEGELGFRERESQMLQELTSRKGVLVATGGGTVLSDMNRNLLRRNGIVVYLRTSVGQQLERLRRDRSRPLLQSANKKDILQELADARNPFYEAVADVVFPAKDRNIDNAVEQIYQAIHTYRQQLKAKPGESDTAGNVS